jgi:hypothetical protein
MQRKPASKMNLSPQKYASLVGRTPARMPTALGKPVWRCSAAELRRLEAWHLEVAGFFGQLAKSAGAHTEHQLGPSMRVMIDRHQELQRALWTWALGVWS